MLPASAFGEDAGALRIRVATGLLYGDSERQREAALEVRDPVSLPWIAAALPGSATSWPTSGTEQRRPVLNQELLHSGFMISG